MSVTDTARALLLLDDAALRRIVAAGDHGPLDGFELDDTERALVVAAVTGEPVDDVAGYAAFAPPYVPAGSSVPLMHAVRYVEDGLTDPTVRRDFTSFTAKLGAQGTW